MNGQTIFDFLNEQFPVDTACDFDNVGFLVGDRNSEVTGVLVALDCDKFTITAALENGCNLIITHHPIIFSGIKQLNDGDPVFALIHNHIAVISMHTNLDVGVGGINDCLCTAIGLSETQTVTASDGYNLRRGTIPETTAKDFAQHLRQTLGTAVKYVDGGKPIRKVLVCSGSGGDFLGEVQKSGCDAFVTADVKHNIFIDAINGDISVFDAGHFATEDIIVEPLAGLLRTAFADLKVLTYHSDKIQFAE